MTNYETWNGRTVSEWRSDLINEAHRDAVSLDQIIEMGSRGFGLSGDHLANFVSENLHAVILSGARPLELDNNKRWRRTHIYGSSPEQIVETVLAQYRPSDPEPWLSAPWFSALYDA